MSNLIAAPAHPQDGRPVAPASRLRFVEAALELFVENGYNGTSLQMIGDRLGVSKAAVAYHFRSKDDLLVAVLTPAFAELSEILDQAEAARRESQRRSLALEGYVDYLVRHRRVSTWLGRDVAALTHPAVLDLIAGFTQRMDALLVGTDDVLARIWGGALLQSLTGALLAAPDVGDAVLRDELERIGRHLIRGYQSARRQACANPTETR